jgi:hypothetical protein
VLYPYSPYTPATICESSHVACKNVAKAHGCSPYGVDLTFSLSYIENPARHNTNPEVKSTTLEGSAVFLELASLVMRGNRVAIAFVTALQHWNPASIIPAGFDVSPFGKIKYLV